MYEKQFISEAVQRSAATDVDRRKLFTMLGVAGVGAAAATVVGGAAANAAPADAASDAATDAAVLNFALNLEYLEAEFYLRAVTGEGLGSKDVHGTGKYGTVSGGHEVPFKSKAIAKYAREIARDEREHVRFLRGALGKSAVARPKISLDAAFTAAAVAAGVIKKGQKFDAFANDTNFLLAAFLFEDVGVTAYKGAAGLITNKTYLDAAAGILAVEAYHAGAIRTVLSAEAEKNHAVYGIVQKLSDARDSLDGKGDDDQGIKYGSDSGWKPKNPSNLVPTDRHGIAYGRTPDHVLNIVYLNPKKVTKGGFYPNGVNGGVNTSGGAAS
ncbi:ferritin-like domain-containing protein [Amnibacterium setariae]|uniref:Ferritin-like domain-containing protein n=1 Tax=Amnibacterium setariae TaxID=2306585 RepID=A0A3A1U6Q0_9MICO|nr:ferritin-like domain-containing protein [Amnibacterium setariae]RIX29979.1 ferritin-like domain-containing protein [Amnibacterium setariae]